MTKKQKENKVFSLFIHDLFMATYQMMGPAKRVEQRDDPRMELRFNREQD